MKTNATVYMGHRLAKPAVESVTLHGRYAMTIRFNQAVGRAEDLTCYSIQSEDIWGWHVKVKQALASADSRSVSLYTEPLYQGTYTIKLNKMTSAMTAANVSDSGTVYRFTVEDWPKDRAFYLHDSGCLPLFWAAVGAAGRAACCAAARSARRKSWPKPNTC